MGGGGGRSWEAVGLRRRVLRADVQFPLGGAGGGVPAVRCHGSEGGERTRGVEEAVLRLPRPFGCGHHGLKQEQGKKTIDIDVNLTKQCVSVVWLALGTVILRPTLRPRENYDDNLTKHNL